MGALVTVIDVPTDAVIPVVALPIVWLWVPRAVPVVGAGETTELPVEPVAKDWVPVWVWEVLLIVLPSSSWLCVRSVEPVLPEPWVWPASVTVTVPLSRTAVLA